MVNPLNILHTVEFYAPRVGGAETVVQKISERLVARGHQVTVATSKLPERDFSSLNGVKIEQFDVGGNAVNGLTGTEIEKYQDFLERFPGQIMLNYAAQQWATDLAFKSLSSSLNRRVNLLAPCGYSALSEATRLAVPEYKDYFQVILPSVLPHYTAIVYHSNKFKDFEFGNLLGLTNGLVIPNAADEDEFDKPIQINFREKYNISTKCFLLSVGNFLPFKGQDRLIEAMRRLNRDDITLVLIGNEMGTLEELRAQAQGLRVLMLTDIPRADTVDALKSCDLFVFASYTEASPLVIIEAKASRKAFVTTDCGNVREFKGGVVCDPNQMAEGIAYLLGNERLRQQLADEGWKEWQERLTWGAVSRMYEQVYTQLAVANGLIK